MYVPVSKRSKKEQRAYYSSQRKTWGCCSPITKVIPNKKKKVEKIEIDIYLQI